MNVDKVMLWGMVGLRLLLLLYHCKRFSERKRIAKEEVKEEFASVEPSVNARSPLRV